jgi:hypothetical protein
MERTIPLLEELKAEAVRLTMAAGGEGGDKILKLIERVEKALQFLLAVANFASDRVAYPERLQQKLRELGLK